MKWMIKGSFFPPLPNPFPLNHKHTLSFSNRCTITNLYRCFCSAYSPRELHPVLRTMDDGADFGLYHLVLGVCDAGERVDR